MFLPSSLLLLALSPELIQRVSHSPHLHLAIVQKGKIQHKSFGDLQRDSLVPIGSLSKVFAAETLVRLVETKSLRLDRQLPSFRLSLLQLATHTAGLPRNADTRAFPTSLAWLSAQAFPVSVPPSAAYSNIGFQLLGEAIAELVRKPYPTLLAQSITRPLGLKDTTATPSVEQCRRAFHHSPCSAFPHLAATASLYSTPDDMARFLQHVVAHPNLAHRPYFTRDRLQQMDGFDLAGPASALGLAWVHLAAEPPAPRIIQKTGAFNGFFSYLAFAPDKAAGIFVVFPGEDLAIFQAVVQEANRFLATLPE